MNVRVLVLYGTSTLGDACVNVRVLVLSGYWCSLPTLTYFEVDLSSWSARWHPDFLRNSPPLTSRE
jgi:hypothetical protein